MRSDEAVWSGEELKPWGINHRHTNVAVSSTQCDLLGVSLASRVTPLATQKPPLVGFINRLSREFEGKLPHPLVRSTLKGRTGSRAKDYGGVVVGDG